MNLDLHNHTKRCNHASGECEEYVLNAIKEKIDIFGFACHAPMKFDEKYRMGLNEVDEYLNEVLNLREKYRNKIDIRVGFEVDYIYGREDLIEQKVLNSDVDYLIGSVHFLNDWGFDNPEFLGKYESLDMEKVWEDYLVSIKNMAQSALFDIVGHVDLLKIFNHPPTNRAQKFIEDALCAISENKMALEINTAGLRKPINEIYPSENILQLARELNIQITFASDAHAPNQVGFKQDFARNLAKKIGFKSALAFKNRKKEEYEI